MPNAPSNDFLGSDVNAAYELIQKVEATDARTVTVTWKQPYIEADFMFSSMFGLPLPRHLLELVACRAEFALLEQAPRGTPADPP